MIVSGVISKDIYPQNKISWSLGLLSQPVTGNQNFNLFFSGENNLLQIFNLKNNKIYNKNNYLIGNYSSNENTLFSGNINETSFDLYKNNSLLYGAENKNRFNLSSFILSGDSNFVDVQNFTIYGKRPVFSIETSKDYIFQDTTIPISIFNNGSSFIQVFSGFLPNNDFILTIPNNFLISPSGSGSFSLINTGLLIGVSALPITLYTNIGNLNFDITISGYVLETPENQIQYISFGPQNNDIPDASTVGYILSFYDKKDIQLSVQLNHISGFTGDYFLPIQRVSFVDSKTVSGFIQGSGFLFGEITGLVSGFNTLRNYYEYGTGSGTASFFKIAEDQYIEKNYNILASGFGDVYSLTNISAQGGKDGILYSGLINYQGGLLTGFYSGLVTGVVPDAKRGWYVNSSGNFVPPPISESAYNSICSSNLGNSICSQYSFAYDYRTAIKTGFVTKFFNYTGALLISFNPSEYETVTLLSPPLSPTGLVTGFFKITGGALATGERISGKLIGDYLLNFEPGKWVISKPYVGVITGESFLLWGKDGLGFDPVEGESSPTSSSGFFSGIVSTGLNITFCDPKIPDKLEIKAIPGSVFASQCFKNDTNYTYQYTGYILRPISGEQERFFENSYFQLISGSYQLYNGHPTGGRTRISRLGATLSGSGVFYHLFDMPNIKLNFESGFTGLNSILQPIANNYNGGGWEERLTTLEPFTVFDTGIPPSITDVSIESQLLYPCDPTIIYFTIKDPDFYLINNSSINNCWSGCFSNWPKKQYSVESSGTIVFVNSSNPEFSSDNFNYGLEFQICNTENFGQKMVRLLYLNPSIEPIIRSSIGDQILIFNNNYYNGTYYINSVNYFSNFRDIRLGLSCTPPPIVVPCDSSNIETKLWVYDEAYNIVDPNWCRIFSSSSSSSSSSS